MPVRGAPAADDQQKRYSAGQVQPAHRHDVGRARAADRSELEHRRCRIEADAVAPHSAARNCATDELRKRVGAARPVARGDARGRSVPGRMQVCHASCHAPAGSPMVVGVRRGLENRCASLAHRGFESLPLRLVSARDAAWRAGIRPPGLCGSVSAHRIWVVRHFVPAAFPRRAVVEPLSAVSGQPDLPRRLPVPAGAVRGQPDRAEP